jgi:hypothetical protein
VKRLPFLFVALAVVALLAASTSTAAATYQRFTNPSQAAKRLTIASGKVLNLFHPCFVVNPYLIRCGGSYRLEGSRFRASMTWRKLNPYMLELDLHIFGPVAAGAGINDTVRRIDTGVPY